MSKEREYEIRKALKEKLSELFDVHEEVVGYWPLDNRLLRIDLLLFPNEKAKLLGIEVQSIGVEIKDKKGKESVKKLLDGIMQAHTYTLCEFNGIRPDFVLIYPEIDQFFQEDWENKYKFAPTEKPTSRELKVIRQLMQRANVGELILKPTKYEFRFSGGPYFDSIKGRSKITGIGLNRYIGSTKRIN